MSLHIGDTAPDFSADTSTGPMKFHDWIGSSWVFFFSHPGDFTPVCTTEMGRTSQLSEQFTKRGVKPIGLPTDTVEEHVKWIDDVNDTQDTDLRFPIVADAGLTIAKRYDMIHPSESETAAVRSVFIIGPDKKIKAFLVYPMTSGRNFDEILRLLDSIQLTARHTVATPVNWKNGDDIIIPPSVSDDDAKKKFPDGWKALKPYLRVAKQPQ